MDQPQTGQVLLIVDCPHCLGQKFVEIRQLKDAKEYVGRGKCTRCKGRGRIGQLVNPEKYQSLRWQVAQNMKQFLNYYLEDER